MELNEVRASWWVVAVILTSMVFMLMLWAGSRQTPPADMPECEAPSEVLVLEDPTDPSCVEPSNQ